MKVLIRSLMSFAVFVVSQTALAQTDVLVSNVSASAYILREDTVIGIDLIMSKVLKCETVDENTIEAVVESREGVRILIEAQVTCLELASSISDVHVIPIEDSGFQTEYTMTEKGCMKSEGRIVELHVGGLTKDASALQNSLVLPTSLVKNSFCK